MEDFFFHPRLSYRCHRVKSLLVHRMQEYAVVKREKSRFDSLLDSISLTFFSSLDRVALQPSYLRDSVSYILLLLVYLFFFLFFSCINLSWTTCEHVSPLQLRMSINKFLVFYSCIFRYTLLTHNTSFIPRSSVSYGRKRGVRNLPPS